MTKQLQQLARTYYTEQRAFFVLLGLCLLFFFAYIYFVSAAIVHVVVRDEVLSKSSDVTSEISELEAEYFSKAKVITHEYARAQGFVPLAQKTYIERPSSGVALNNR